MQIAIYDNYKNAWQVEAEIVPVVGDFVSLFFDDPNNEIEPEWIRAKVIEREICIRPSNVSDDEWEEGSCEVEFRVVLEQHPPDGLFASSEYISPGESMNRKKKVEELNEWARQFFGREILNG